MQRLIAANAAVACHNIFFSASAPCSAAPFSFLQLKQLCIKHTLGKLNSREILVKGKLFDVKEVQATGDGITVTGVFDEEAAMLHQIRYILQRRSIKSRTCVYVFFQLLQALVFQPEGVQHAVAEATGKLFQNPILLLMQSVLFLSWLQ